MFSNITGRDDAARGSCSCHSSLAFCACYCLACNSRPKQVSCHSPAFMTNRPPAPGTYDPRDWKCPNCKTLNFKKRKNCLSCSTERPPQTKEQVMPDWRTGKKDCGANVNADWTCRFCGAFNFGTERFCTACGPAPDWKSSFDPLWP